MLSRFSQWLRSFDRDTLKRVSTGAKWSALTRIGNSYVVKLTILAPFVGSFLIFNQNILDIFDFSKKFLVDINKDSLSNGISEYAFNKLYFIYFGLFSIGIGSIIYSIYCPENISKFPYSDEYNRSRIGLNSPTLCVSSFESVVEAFASDSDSLPWYRRTRRDELAYSDELRQLTYSLLLRMHGAWDWSFGEDEATLPEDESQDFGENHESGHRTQELNFDGDVTNAYYTPNGYVDIDSMARDLISSPRIIWNITIPLKDSSFKFQSDVYHLHYMADDLSMPYQRLTCAGAYALGFIILFLPSMETFLRVLAYAFGIIR